MNRLTGPTVLVLLLATSTASANADYPLGFTPKRDGRVAEAMREAGLDVDSASYGVMAGLSLQTGPTEPGFGGGLAWYPSRNLEMQLHVDVGNTLIASDWLVSARMLFTGGKRITFLAGLEGFAADGVTSGGGGQLDLGLGLAFKPVRIGVVLAFGITNAGDENNSGSQGYSRGFVQLHVPINKSLGINADYLLTNANAADNMDQLRPVFSLGVRKTL